MNDNNGPCRDAAKIEAQAALLGWLRGKVSDAEKALEIREELAVDIAVDEQFEEVTHAYPEKTVHLKFFICRLIEGEPQAIGCAAFHWATKAELGNFEFPAADRQLLEKLQNVALF